MIFRLNLGYEALCLVCYKVEAIGKSMGFLHSNLKITRVVQFHHVWLILMRRYGRVATKNDQKHCLTPSESGDRSTQTWRS